MDVARDGRARPVARGVLRASPSRSREGARAGRSRRRSREQRDRRRVRARTGWRARSRSRARACEVTVLEAEDDDRRRRAQRRADAPGARCTTSARRCTRWPSAPRSCARSGSSATGSSGCWPEVDLAHPLDDGSAGVMLRSVDGDGRRRSGEDGAAWRRVFGRPSASFDELSDDLFRPVLHVPRHPLRLVRFGVPAAMPATVLARAWQTPAGARALRRRRRARGQPAEPPDELVGRDGADLRRATAFGWAVARGGSGAITGALASRAARARRHDRDRRARQLARRAPGRRRRRARPGARAPSPTSRATACRARVARAYRRYRHGPGRVQGRPRGRGRRAVDERGVPPRRHGARWAARSRRSSPPSATSTAAGCRSGRSCSSPSSTSPTRALARATSTRSGPTRTCRTATTATPTEAILGQIERFAPGLRERIVATAVRTTARDRGAQRRTTSAATSSPGRTRRCRSADPARGSRSTPTAPASRASSSARPPRRRARACTG